MNIKPKQIAMRSMDEAPKDGSKIILFYYTGEAYHREFKAHICWWWEPTEPHQWKSGARPHWCYVDDRDTAMCLHSPVGWLPVPVDETKTLTF